MELSTLPETNIQSATKEIARLLWYWNVHYRVHQRYHWSLSEAKRVQFTSSNLLS